MIKLYLRSKMGNYDAIADYDPTTKEITVLKNSRIASDVSGMFRSSKSIIKLRENTDIANNVLNENISFKSASSAGNFVTGRSTNGLISWKTKQGVTLKALLDQTI